MRLSTGRGFGLAALITLAGAAAWHLARQHPDTAALAAAGGGGLLLLALWARAYQRGRARRAARRNADHLVRIAEAAAAEHARTLAIKRNQLIVRDEYGTYDYGRWTRHLAYFIERVVFRDAAETGADAGAVAFEGPVWLEIEAAIEAAIEAYETRAEPADISDVRSGEDYEHLCRTLLEEEGWRVIVTAGTGDQGADLVAEGPGGRVAIQCKFYSRPVGNRAVQEAFAAGRFQAADHAAVVSNSSFTRSAQQLALTNGVLLLHHDELADLGTRLRSAA